MDFTEVWEHYLCGYKISAFCDFWSKMTRLLGTSYQNKHEYTTRLNHMMSRNYKPPAMREQSKTGQKKITYIVPYGDTIVLEIQVEPKWKGEKVLLKRGTNYAWPNVIFVLEGQKLRCKLL